MPLLEAELFLQSSQMEALTLDVAAFWDRGWKEAARITWGPPARPHPRWLGSHSGRWAHRAQAVWGHSNRAVIHKPSGEPSGETKRTYTLTLDSQLHHCEEISLRACSGQWSSPGRAHVWPEVPETRLQLPPVIIPCIRHLGWAAFHILLTFLLPS